MRTSGCTLRTTALCFEPSILQLYLITSTFLYQKRLRTISPYTQSLLLARILATALTCPGEHIFSYSVFIYEAGHGNNAAEISPPIAKGALVLKSVEEY